MGDRVATSPWTFWIACEFAEAVWLRLGLFALLVGVHLSIACCSKRTWIVDIAYHAVLWIGFVALLVSVAGMMAIVS